MLKYRTMKPGQMSVAVLAVAVPIVVLTAMSVATASVAHVGHSSSSQPATKHYVKSEIHKLAPHLAVKHARKANHATTADNATNLGDAPASAYQHQVMWAFVTSDGTIGAQSGGISVAFYDGTNFPGQYYLSLPASAANAAVSVTRHYDQIGTTSGEAATGVCGDPLGTDALPSGQIKCNVGGNSTSEIYIRTFSSSGAVVAGSFYVTVTPNGGALS